MAIDTSVLPTTSSTTSADNSTPVDRSNDDCGLKQALARERQDAALEDRPPENNPQKQEDEQDEFDPQKFISLSILTPSELEKQCTEDLNEPYLIEGFIRAGSLTILGGDSGIGKSPLGCQIALSVAAGIPCFGMATKCSRVLYIDLENSQQEHKAMQDALARHLGLDRVPPKFLMTSEAITLSNIIPIVKPRLVIIDSLRSFKPDADENNAKAGGWLKDLRELGRTYNVAFILIHHLRKNNHSHMELKPKKLDSEKCAVREFMESMEGPRAFFNQTDTRIAVVPSEKDHVALELKWNLKLHGDSELYQLARILDDAGEPIGYKHLAGLATLSEDQREKFQKLSHEFTFKEAKAALNLSDDPTNKLLKIAQARQVLEKIGRGHYRKLVE